MTRGAGAADKSVATPTGAGAPAPSLTQPLLLLAQSSTQAPTSGAGREPTADGRVQLAVELEHARAHPRGHLGIVPLGAGGVDVNALQHVVRGDRQHRVGEARVLGEVVGMALEIGEVLFESDALRGRPAAPVEPRGAPDVLNARAPRIVVGKCCARGRTGPAGSPACSAPAGLRRHRGRTLRATGRRRYPLEPSVAVSLLGQTRAWWDAPNG